MTSCKDRSERCFAGKPIGFVLIGKAFLCLHVEKGKDVRKWFLFDRKHDNVVVDTIHFFP